MNRLVTCGFETADINEAGATPVIGANNSLTVVSTAPAPRAGAYCLKALVTASTQFAVTNKTFPLSTSKTDVWFRCAFLASGTIPSAVSIMGVNDSAGLTQGTITYNGSDNLLRAYRGNSSNTLLGVSSQSMSLSAWHVIEVRWQILTGTTGAAEVWLDGTQVINFSGDTSQTSTLNVGAVFLGVNVSAGGAATGSYLAWDDLAINDTSGTLNNGRPGDGRVVLLVPTGAGSTTALSRGGTDTGANWSQTNELPPSMTQYVFSATAATRDTYALSDLPSGVASINVADVLALAQNSDAGAGSLGLTVKSGATTTEGPDQAMGTAACIR